MTNALIHIFIRDAEKHRRFAGGVKKIRRVVRCGRTGMQPVSCFALKLIIGLLTGSISIAADAFNNLSDGLSCLISIVGFKVFWQGAGCESIRSATDAPSISRD